MRVALTGGTGFVGATLIDQLLEKGHMVTALARNPKRIRRADDVTIIEGDLDNQQALNQLAKDADIFVHLAGVTHPKDDADFTSVNVSGAVRAAKAAATSGAKFIHISSLTARKPDISPYGQSKFASEDAVKAASGDNPWLALRLPAIYGPGDLVTLPYFKLVKSGLALEPKSITPARASLLFVGDAAGAIIAAAIEAPPRAVYEVGDDQTDGHGWSQIGEILGNTLNTHPKAIKVPRPIIAVYHGALRKVEHLLGRSPSVRTDQINEFFYPDWVARDNLLISAISWRPKTALKDGFAITARWYQENDLL